MPETLCPASEVTEAGKEIILESQGRPFYLALFRHSGEIFAYHNVCPHQGRNLNFAPDRFLFDPGGRLVCPHHGAIFDVSSGHCIQGPCQGDSLRRVQVSVRQDSVVLEEPGLLAGS